MSIRCRSALLCLVLLMSSASGQGQVPDTLFLSVFHPGTNSQGQARLGWSTALDGNLAVVGVPFDDVPLADAGRVRVFDATTGALLHTLTNPAPADITFFGWAVGCGGSRVVVAANSTLGTAGRTDLAYVFDLTSPAPTAPVATLNDPALMGSSYSVEALAMAGNIVVIASSGPGGVHVFDLSAPAPSLSVARLINPAPQSQDFFGTVLAVSGMRVVIGAYGRDLGATAAGCAYVYELSGASPLMPSLILTNPTPTAFEYFGSAAAISGTRVVIGAQRDDTSGTDAGSAYVFDLTGASPLVPMLTLTNPSPAVEDRFGYAVAISGTRVVINALQDDTGATDTGIAYLFDLTHPIPLVPVATFTNPAPASTDYFGASLAMAGSRILVGSPYDDALATDSGAAYLYDAASPGPGAPIPLIVPSPSSFDRFGQAVALSGNIAVAGVHQDDTGAANAGRAYVYDLTSPTPALPLLHLVNPSPAANDFFGYAVAVAGSRIVVGAHWDNAGLTDAGTAYVYDLSNATPALPVLTLTNPAPAVSDYFGSAVAMQGTRVAVGAPGDNAGANDAGSAYLFDLTSPTTTVPVLTLSNPQPAVGDNFGFAVALSAQRLLVGAHKDDAGAIDSGSAYVYDLTGAPSTLPVVTLTNPSPAADDFFGWSVALSGTRAVVSAPRDDTGALDAGSVYVFELSQAVPAVSVLVLTNPFPADLAYFGQSVAIAGSVLAVGAYLDDLGATDAGTVYVFDLAGATPKRPVMVLTHPQPALNDQFGTSVALDGALLMVGAPLNDNVAADRGAAYVFGVRPTLRITPGAPGFATVSWTPSNSPGFVLQQTENLTNWLNAASGPTNPVTLPATNPARIHRLIRP